MKMSQNTKSSYISCRTNTPYNICFICWYHYKFDENATKCKKPCQFKFGHRVSDPRFFVRDLLTNMLFLVDHGAERSFYPYSATTTKEQRKYTGEKYMSADDSPIRRYGTTSIKLDLGLPYKIIWSFHVAEIAHGILGADFLYHKHLHFDTPTERLIPMQLQSLRNLYYHRDPLQGGYRLFLTDRISNFKCLVDTGATVSVFPFSAISDKSEIESADEYGTIRTPNGIMKCCGTLRRDIDIGFDRRFSAHFRVAHVKIIIMGIDFLTHYKLSVDEDLSKLIPVSNTLRP